MEPILYHLPYSPWSEKARWALDHHRVACKRRLYLPIFGAPLLKRRTRHPGKVTVPVLLCNGKALTDSWDIARWAEEHGSGAPLFFDEPKVREWNEKSEALLDAGRARATFRVARDHRALVDSVPSPFSKVPVVSTLFGKLGVVFLRNKYEFDEQDAHDKEQEMRDILDQTRARLVSGHLLGGRFSYADLAMAVALAFVKPADRRYSKLSENTQRAFEDPALARDYADLVTWRDELYARHRKPST